VFSLSVLVSDCVPCRITLQHATLTAPLFGPRMKTDGVPVAVATLRYIGCGSANRPNGLAVQLSLVHDTFESFESFSKSVVDVRSVCCSQILCFATSIPN